MEFDCLPLATPYDPAEDPPGSIDPLGTVPGAEQLADVLFEGMTARMWRARHLTFTALAALVAEQVARDGDGSEELRLEARLALERLFVSAVARREKTDLEQWREASRRLPGIGLARRALRSADQALGRQNFLKGQAINGPFGVVSRLARHVGIIDDDNRLDRNGRELLLAWAAKEKLPGLMDENGSASEGAQWIRKLRKAVRDYARDSDWPKASWWGWKDLAERLRPDQPGSREQQVLYGLLASGQSPVRRRCLELLEHRETVAGYVGFAGSDRGQVDRDILRKHVRPLLDPRQDVVDRSIRYAIDLIDAYEQVGVQLELVMRGLQWALTHHNGRATRNELVSDVNLAPHLDKVRKRLGPSAERLKDCLCELGQHPDVLDAFKKENRLDQLLQDALAGLDGENRLVDQVLERHERVQRQKRKGVWIERDERYWTLIPAFGDNEETLAAYNGGYLHPFRVANAYSLLFDLGRVGEMEVADGQEE